MEYIVVTLIGLATFYAVLKRYVRSTWTKFDEEVDLSGKNVIVTGANTGLGLELSVQLAKRGACVFMACRNPARGEAAINHVRNVVGSSSKVELMKLDVSSLQSVREFVKVFKERADRLDILINNAAVNAAPLSSTEDGLVLTYATNHFGPFLLTNLLLEHMSKSGTETRVVNVGSLSHVTADLDLDYITPHKAKHYIDSLQKNMIKKKDDLLLYQNSKLMVLMFTFELARRLKGRHVTVNCVQPGIVATRMMEDEKHFFRNLIMKLLKPFARGTEDGCQPILHCALSSDLYSVSGKYFGNCVEDHSLHPMALDEQMCKQLWRISENFTRLTDS